MKFATGLIVVCVLLLGFSTNTAHAITLPFTEDFAGSNANWVNYNSSAFLTYNATGGPDGGGYDSGTATFNTRVADSSAVLLRGRQDFGASGDALFGDWAGADARNLSVYVWHNVPTPLTYFVRLAAPAAFPGAIAVSSTPVPANQWTKLSFDLSPTSPAFASFEGSDWSSVFSNIGHVQFGVTTPGALTTDPTFYTFGIDKVVVTAPEPASMISAGIGAVGFAMLLARRRSRPVLS